MMKPSRSKPERPILGGAALPEAAEELPALEFSKGTASQPRRNVFESDVRRGLKPHPFKASVADLEVLPQAVPALCSMLSNQRKLY
jgi:hypothetical protein